MPTRSLPVRSLADVSVWTSVRPCFRLTSRNYSTAAGWANWLFGHLAPASLFAWLFVAQTLNLIDLIARSSQTPSAHGPLLGWMITQRLLSMCLVGLVTILYLIRTEPVARQPWSVSSAVALAGTWILAVRIWLPAANPSLDLILPSILLLAAGNVLALTSLAYLGRRFAILPEARGLITEGPYRWIRHPIYVGEIIAALGALLPEITLYVLVLLGIFVGLQHWRSMNEEQVLRAAFPTYQAYAVHTRRFVPGLY
ncbi:MAG: isoprenylcysteine carboxylmethyltransferase family protein [Chloroflexi bacterium]|nr:isoprenylcysteine carboxylmethyltransferase family protein [Chloroflexota bacterium]